MIRSEFFATKNRAAKAAKIAQAVTTLRLNGNADSDIRRAAGRIGYATVSAETATMVRGILAGLALA